MSIPARPTRLPRPSQRAAATAIALAVTLPLLGGCGASADEPSDGSSGSGAGVRVVTSFYPLQYVTQRIGGEHADVANLTQPGQEPHDIELSVRQTAEIAEADVVVYETGFQPAVDEAVEQSGPDRVVDAADTAELDGEDPHFWLDPTRLAKVSAAVEQQLAEADPDHAEDYARNLETLQSDLTGLDADLEKGLAECSIDTIVVSHDAFGYLGRRYGLEVVGINGLSPDAEPSPAHLRELQDLIRRDGITTVFSEELASREFADSLANDLDIMTAVLDPIEGLSDDTAEEDYLSLMRRNLTTLEKANQCR